MLDKGNFKGFWLVCSCENLSNSIHCRVYEKFETSDVSMLVSCSRPEILNFSQLFLRFHAQTLIDEG